VGSAAFSPERDAPRSRRGNGRAAVAAFAPVCSKLQRLPNKQAINFGFHPPGADRRGKSRPLQTDGLARPLLIRGWMPVLPAGTTPERAAMSTFDNPFDPERRLDRTGCSCGRHRSQAEHDAQPQLQCAPIESEDKRYQGVVASAVMRAVFPKDAARRAFLKSVGASTALAALSQLFPLKTATDVFAQGGAIEKKDLKVGFIPITCATPIIMAHPMGFYSKHGLNVEVIKTAGWAVIRDKTLNKEYDAAHMLSPMPLAITLGAGSNPMPYTMPAVENINGQAITLATKHKDKNDPKLWKGFKFAVPFDYSMHNYLLRYYVAEHGIDPDQDIQIRAVPPPEMVANLRADNIDGFLGPDPFNQRAVYDGVGFIHILSKQLWEGHPCCAFAASKEFVTTMPNTYAALLKSIIDATAFAHKAENRKEIAAAIAPANYLNQPEIVLEQILTGTYADGLGNVKRDPNRIDFDPFPWQSFAVWILTQMKRWGQIKGDVDYKAVAEQVYLATDTAKLMKEVGLTPPTTSSKSFKVMGKEFDPAKPDDYLKSFAIKRV
jgi:nitrate/nitrite transport system substrate-binding protein